jgi:RimJ/RimL family protein N-acetyltransferase
LFVGSTDDELARVESALRPVVLDEGEVLMREGEPASWFALVHAGMLAISRQGAAGPEDLGIAGTGSLVGELGLLRGRPRAATVTALMPSGVLVGDHAAFEALLELGSVQDHVKQLASARLAANLRPTPMKLRDGTSVHLRPLLPSDRAAFIAAVRHWSAESLRRRFFSGGVPSARLLDYLIDIDFVDHFAWVVVDPEADDSLVAVARYIRHADNADLADLAFGVADTHHGRGIATLLFGALGAAASVGGVREFDADVLFENGPMRAVFAKAGARSTLGEFGIVHVTMPVESAVSLLDSSLRHEIEIASRDVVTAAGLALTHNDS